MRFTWIAIGALGLLPPSANACSQVNDGGITVIDYPVTDCLLLINSGTTLVVVEGGSVIPDALNGQDAVRANPGTTVRIAGGLAQGSIGRAGGGVGIYGWGGGVVHVSAGEVRGGNANTSGGRGIHVHGTEALISGGYVRGGDGGTAGGVAVWAAENAVVTITGGTFRSGDGGTSSNWVLATWSGSHVVISGGWFETGQGGSYGTLHFASNTSGLILGGTFVGNDWALALEDTGLGPAVVALHGGVLHGIIGVFGRSILDVYGSGLAVVGGHLVGTLADGSALDSPIHVGPNAQLRLHAPTPVEVSSWAGVKAAFR